MVKHIIGIVKLIKKKDNSPIQRIQWFRGHQEAIYIFNDVLHAETGNIVPVKDAMANSASGVYVAVINLENKRTKHT